MNLDQVKNLAPLYRFTYWIQERESVRLQKEAGKPKPWTDDLILQGYRFCNVRRADDKVSRWLYANWYSPYRDHPNMLLACSLARFFNLPSTLELIGFPVQWDATKVRGLLRKHKEQGNKIFNGAYMVRGNDGVDKIASVINYTIQKMARNPPVINSSSMEETWTNLVPIYGLGSFMAGQITADLRWGITGTWEDRQVWAPLGPGSKRGINRLYERDINSPLSQADFNDHLLKLIHTLTRILPQSIHSRLEAIDWQNCLCEFDKYERVLWEQGRPKSRYAGKG